MNLFELAAVLTLDRSGYDRDLDDAESKGSSFASKLSSGLSTAAKVGAAAIGAVTTATTAATTTLVKGAGEAAAYGDNIDKMSQKMGISAEAYQEWDAVMQHSGTSMETLKAGMKTLANAVENGNEAFERLGISQEEISKMSNEDIFSATISALQQVDNETERTYLAGQLLGRGATELGALLNTSAEDTQAMKDRVHELGGVMSNESVKAAAAFQDSLQDMQTAIDGTKRGLTAEFLPAFTSVMDGITAVMTDDDSGFGTISDGINKAIESLNKVAPKFLNIVVNVVNSLVKAISDNAPQLIDAVSDVVLKLADGAVEALPKLIDAVVDSIPKLIAKLSEALPKLVKAGLEIIKSIAKGISKNIKTVVNTIVDVVIAIVKELTNPNTLKDLLDAGLQIIIGLAQGILESIPRLVEVLPEIIGNIVDFIMDAIPQIIEAGVQLFSALVKELPKIIESIVDVLPKLIKGIIDGLFKPDNIKRIVQAGIDLLKCLVNDIPAITMSIVSSLPDLITGIIDGLFNPENIQSIIQAGIDLLFNLVGNVPKIVGGIITKAPEIITGIGQGLLSAGSALIQVGIQLMNFIGEGMDRAKKWIGQQVSDWWKSITGQYTEEEKAMAARAEELMGQGMTLGETVEQILEENIKVTETGSGGFRPQPSSTGSVDWYSQQSSGPQPLVVQMVMPSGVEVGRQYVEDINMAKRADGRPYL